jgi:hypothetical protein
MYGSMAPEHDRFTVRFPYGTDLLAETEKLQRKVFGI